MFVAHGTKPTFLRFDDGSSIADMARNAVKEGYDVVAAAGGDGTVSGVAGALAGSGCILGVLPMGTLNHFAKDLGIPDDLAGAVAVIAGGRTRDVDVGEVNGRVFINNSSLGLYPAMVRMRESLQRSGEHKWLAFIRASLSILVRFRHLTLDLQPATGPAIRSKTPMLFVGNNSYATGAAGVGRREALDRGRLWLAMSTADTRLNLLAGALEILQGREETTNVIAAEIRTLVVSSSHRSLAVAADGEVFRLSVPLAYRILPKALRVIVPADDEPHADI